MATSTKLHGDSMYGALGALATLLPMLLVVAAGLIPEGLERGQFIVHGCGAILSVLATALVLHASYVLGFSKAVRMAATMKSNYSLTA